MGEIVEFVSNGSTASGYLAIPDAGTGPGVIVLQEWWGLVPQLKGVCDRLAAEGFCALAPDLYHGEYAEHTELDKAGELVASLPMDRATRDMGGAVNFCLAHPATTGDKVGIVGFCMGGALTLSLAVQEGAKVGAAVPYYGAPIGTLGDGTVDWSRLSAHVLGNFAEHDEHFPPDRIRELGEELRAMGKDVTFHIYPGSGHGFANEENPLGQWNEEATRVAWGRTTEFLRKHLG